MSKALNDLKTKLTNSRDLIAALEEKRPRIAMPHERILNATAIMHERKHIAALEATIKDLEPPRPPPIETKTGKQKKAKPKRKPKK